MGTIERIFTAALSSIVVIIILAILGIVTDWISIGYNALFFGHNPYHLEEFVLGWWLHFLLNLLIIGVLGFVSATLMQVIDESIEF
jgi:large-conductance mechanosensitive channel